MELMETLVLKSIPPAVLNSANPNNQFTWSGDIRNNPDGTMPVDFIVDYVKVYQVKPGA